MRIYYVQALCATKITVEKVVFFSALNCNSVFIYVVGARVTRYILLVHTVIYSVGLSLSFCARTCARWVVAETTKRWIFLTRISCCHTRQWPWTTRRRHFNDTRLPTWATITTRPAVVLVVEVPL